ncbi:MAG: hypothetical protein ACI37Q_00530 [Candidatus Gastranaerophilaceae bacterium]
MKIIKVISLSILFLLTLAVIFVTIGIPRILNSTFAMTKLEQILSKKSGYDITLQGFKVTFANDFSYRIFVDSLDAKAGDAEIFEIEDLDFTSKILATKADKLNIKSIYLDFEKLKPKLEANKNKNSTSLNINYLPIVNIQEAIVRFDDKSGIKFINIHSEKLDDTVYCVLTAYLTVPYSKEPIIIGEDGYLYFNKSVNFEDFTLRYKNSKLNLTGTIDNLNFNGKDLSVYDLKNFFIFFYHTQHNNKRNFIENFENMTGLLDVDLTWSKKGLNGKCLAHNLSADFSKFKIPVTLPYVRFNFNGHDIRAAANGSFGGENLYTDVWIKGVATNNLTTTGNVKSKLSSSFTKSYFPQVEISGLAEALVSYKTAKGKTDINYLLNVPKNSNIISKFGALDNTDKYRQISAQTIKTPNNLQIKTYDYSFINNGKKDLMLSGDGYFEQKKSSLSPVYITFKTNGAVPMKLIESFTAEYLTGGTFDGNLKYNFKDKMINGNLSVYNSHHKDFMYVKKSDIKVSKDKINIDVIGEFFNSPIKMNFIAANDFKQGVLIDNIDINLDKYLITRGNISTIKTAFPKKEHKNNGIKKEYKYTVKTGKIRVGEISHPKFSLKNAEIYGSLNNNIVDFVIPTTAYACGLLTAKGKYNVKDHSSNIYFLASDIDSNEVATKIFNLPNQFEGTAFATLHMKTKNKLNDIHAHATFAISDGYLPKLGSREIIINASNKKTPLHFLKKTFKFTLSKITNIDFSNPKIFQADLNGSFILDNSLVHNVKIYSQGDYLSLFLTGNYDISTQVGNLTVWGKRDKLAERKIRIFKIPLSLIYKVVFRKEYSKDQNSNIIKQIPPIKADVSQTGLFRVLVKGDLNADKLDLDFKDIR